MHAPPSPMLIKQKAVFEEAELASLHAKCIKYQYKYNHGVGLQTETTPLNTTAESRDRNTDLGTHMTLTTDCDGTTGN